MAAHFVFITSSRLAKREMLDPGPPADRRSYGLLRSYF